MKLKCSHINTCGVYNRANSGSMGGFADVCVGGGGRLKPVL